MPIGIEQLDLKSMSKYFPLKKDIETIVEDKLGGTIFNKNVLIDLLAGLTTEERATAGINIFDKTTLITILQSFSQQDKELAGLQVDATFKKSDLIYLLQSLTEEERIEVGLMADPIPERPALRQLIIECQEELAEAVVGTDTGEFSQLSVDVFTDAITTAIGLMNTDSPTVTQAIVDLNTARQTFRVSKITDAGVLSGNTWYGSEPPINPEYDWVPLTILSKKYWVSLHPIDPGAMDVEGMVWLYGLYIPTSAILYTRFGIPVDVTEDITLIDGSIYNNKWFGDSADVIPEIENYLGLDSGDIGFVKSRFQAVNANPPLIPKAGDAWYGSASDMDYLPPTLTEYEQYLNIVAAFGS